MEKNGKKIKKAGVIAAAAMLALVMSLSLVACNNDGGMTVAVQKATSYVTLDINPSLELVLDQNDTVMSVSAGNYDAEVLLWQENGIIGASLDAAVDRIATLAVEMKFLTDENNNISVTVTSKSDVNEQEIFNRINGKITAVAEKYSVPASVSEAVDLVLSKELERIKAANAGKSGYGDALTVSRYRLVLAAMSADYKLAMDEAVLKTNEELIKIVNEADAQIVKNFGSAYEKAVEEARFALELAKQTVSDTAYFAIDPDDVNWNYHFTAGKYVALNAARLALEHYYYSLKDAIENPVITEEDAKGVLNAVGIATVGGDFDAIKAKLKDENGDITLKNVNAYVNKVYRNAEASVKESMENGYAAAQEILNRITVNLNELQASITEITEALALKDWTFNQAGQTAGVIGDIASGATEAAINLALGFLGIENKIDLDNPDSVETVLGEMDGAVTAAKNELDEKLTEAQKRTVETARASAVASIERAEKAFEDAVEVARSEATAALNAAKEAALGIYSGDFTPAAY